MQLRVAGLAALAMVSAIGCTQRLAAGSDSRIETASPQNATSVETRLDSIASAAFPAGQPGAAVIVVHGGSILLRKGYGLASVELGVPITPEMVFEVGSISKQFTASAILLLAQEGRLALTDDVRKYVQDITPSAQPITIEHLLTHTSGLANFTELDEWRPLQRLDVAPRELIAMISRAPRSGAPGDRFAYSNSGYFLLAEIIERVSGQSYAEFLEQRVFRPLGMSRSSVDDKRRIVAGRALGYERRGGAVVNAGYLSLTHARGTGSIASTIDDLARWDAALYETRILTPPSKTAAWRPFRLTNGSTTTYGYGWFLAELDGRAMQLHGGVISGYSAAALRIPDERVFVAILSNVGSGEPHPFAVARQLASAVVTPQRVAR